MKKFVAVILFVCPCVIQCYCISLSLVENSSVSQAMDGTLYQFIGVMTHTGCWQNTKKICKSRTSDEWFITLARVLSTLCVITMVN